MQQFGKNLAVLILSILFVNINYIKAQYEVEHDFNFKNTIQEQEDYILSLSEFIAQHKALEKAAYISAEELNTALQADKKIYILDAREEKAYNISHIEKAHQIGFEDFNTEKIWMIPKKGKIVVYCTINEVSPIIANYLSYLGYKDVSVLHMSIVGWSNANLPLYDGQNNKTNKVLLNKKNQGAYLKKGKAVWN